MEQQGCWVLNYLEGFQGEDFQATKGESCRIHGHLEVNRVSGSIHIAPGKTVQIDGHLVHDVRGMRALSHDTSHTIHHFSFGDEFPSQINPLDDTDVRACLVDYTLPNRAFLA